jgi:flagellar basal body-associated protein FliL
MDLVAREKKLLMGSLAMTDATRIRHIIISVLLIVLVLAMTTGMAWHYHDQCSAGDCTLCHLAIAPPTAVIRAIELVPVTAEYAVRENRFVSHRGANERPPRAPPA